MISAYEQKECGVLSDRHTRSRDPLRRRRSPRRPRHRAVRRARRSVARKLLPGALPPRSRRADARRTTGHRHLPQGRDGQGLPRGRQEGDRQARPARPSSASRSRLEFSAFSAEDPAPLVDAVAKAEKELGDSPRRLHYLSIPPNAFGATVAALGEPASSDRSRVVLEKPFGVDLESAIALNKLVHGVFDEERVFRIDHFLGREAVQNLIALRFANGMFEPIWNKRPHRPRPDRRPRDARGRRPRRVLRGHRRLPRHGRHPPLPRARLRGHGAADRARRRARSSRRPARSSARSSRSARTA